MKSKYKHAEAFCHMTYRTVDGDEWSVWNSRDGVTPFFLTIDGKKCLHVIWKKDRRDVQYEPKSGDYVFVDATVDSLLKDRREWYDHWLKEDGKYFQEQFPGDKEDVCFRLAKQDLTEHGEPPPDLVLVSAEFAAGFVAGRRSSWSGLL